MVKRAKRLEKGIESLKEEIEEHFCKINIDLQEQNIDRGRYHFKEVNKSFLKTLKDKIDILGIQDSSIQGYKERLEILRKSLGLKEDELV